MTATAPALDVLLTVEQLWQPVPGGSGTYVRDLARALVARDDVAVHGLRARSRGGDDRRGLPLRLDVRSSRLPRPLLYEAWTRWRRPRVPGRGPAVLHATTWAVPPRTAPLVVTVHDIAFRRNPEHFTPRGVAFFERALEVTRREADAVVVPSRVTRDDAVAAGIDPGRVHVVPHGVSTVPVDPASSTFRERHGIVRPYVLWCGAIEPRKNLGVLLDAFGRLTAGTDLDLVLVGPDGWGGAADELRVRRAALPTGRVHVLGSLPWTELHEAYAAARVFAFPSLWEGFGMPVLEAQAHGVPVVTSQGTSMAEVCGDGALLADPRDPAAFAAAIAAAAEDRHAVLSAAARANAAAYTWERSAELHVAVYREAVARGEGRPSGGGR